MRHYIRLDPRLPDHKERYSDGLLAAFTLTFCFCEHQPERGRFRNRGVLSALLGRRSRHIDRLLAAGDLVLLPDGSLYFEGWDEWQEGNWQVAERMQRVRDRQKGQKVTVPVTVPVTPETVTVPYIAENREQKTKTVGGELGLSQIATLLSMPRVVPDEDPVLQLQVWWQEFNGGRISEHDKQAAAALIVDCQRLGLAGITARITEHAEWRTKNGKKPLGKLEFYRDTLRDQENHLADSGVLRPREIVQ